MRLPKVRVFTVLLSNLLCVNGRLIAQSEGATEPASGCVGSNRLLRTAAGAMLGAGLGFFAIKIKQSDWNDASRGDAAHRTRNRVTFGGAIIGAALGNVRFGTQSCGAGVPHATSPKATGPRRPITADEIQRSGISGSAYDLVRSLRPSWLNTRGIDTGKEVPRVAENARGETVIVPGEPQLMVYLDNVRLGTISQLSTISAAGVLGVRYYDGPQATFRWGAGHTHGAIEVLTLTEIAR